MTARDLLIVNAMKHLGADLKTHAPAILQLWRKVILEPPMRLAADHDVGRLPDIIYDLIEVSLLQPHDLGAHEQKVRDAIAHGERRRMEGAAELIIYEEFAALREAVRRYLETCELPRWKEREALMRLDMAITVSELAALNGYNRDSLERIGRWDALVVEMAKRSPLLGLPDPP